MSTSNTITKNDLISILNSIYAKSQSCPVGHKNLLWTNPSPTSAFAAQTVSLDLSGYDEVEIQFKHFTDSNVYAFAKCFKNDGYGMACVPSDSNSGIMRRRFNMTSTGVVFATGQGVAYDGVYYADQPSAAIPWKIYGIKYSTANMSLESLGIHISTAEPTSADGDDGDIWIKYEV